MIRRHVCCLPPHEGAGYGVGSDWSCSCRRLYRYTLNGWRQRGRRRFSLSEHVRVWFANRDRVCADLRFARANRYGR